MRRWLLPLLALAGVATAAPMKWPDLLNRPHPKADARIAYGADPLQHVDLWLPQGRAPHPVVLMVHGGCWQTDVATADIMDWISDDLRRRGIAVWNIEYRGVDRPGGGYPGTFEDVATASDLLASSAAKYRLKADRVVVVGHSAGGHLALWLAARGGLKRGTPLWRARPLPIQAAISLGGLPDLEAASVAPGNTCETAPVDKLVDRARPQPYADTSPAVMPQPSVPIVLVNATRDHIAPPAFAEAYEARVHNPQLRRVTIADEGHVELIAPESAAWKATVREIEAALRP